MKGLSSVFLVGTLTRDPELRYTPTGTPVLDFTLSGEDEVVTNNGEVKRLPWFHRGNLWGKPAEWLAERDVKQGDVMACFGTLEYSAWEDVNGGGKRSRLQIKASRLEPLSGDFKHIEDAGGGVRLAQGAVNQVNVVGNLTRDVEVKQTPAGEAVANLSLAVNESYQQNGEWKEKVHYVDATAWRGLAEQAQELRKGAGVVLQGRLKNESWVDKDGQKRSSTKLEVLTLLSVVTTDAGRPAQAAAPEAKPRWGNKQPIAPVSSLDSIPGVDATEELPF